MKAYRRIFSLNYVRMQIQKISVLIRLALRSTRVLMVGKKREIRLSDAQRAV